jgi:hypothetical protein
VERSNVHRCFRVFLGVFLLGTTLAAKATLAATPEAGYLHHHLEADVIGFLERKTPCYAAVFQTLKKGLGFREGDVYSKMFCLFDGVTGEGTISEKRGCIAATYDMETGRYLSLFKPQYRAPPLMAHGACSDEGSITTILSNQTMYEWVFREVTGEYAHEVIRKVVFWGPGGEQLRDAACRKGMKRKRFPKKLFCADK